MQGFGKQVQITFEGRRINIRVHHNKYPDVDAAARAARDAAEKALHGGESAGDAKKAGEAALKAYELVTKDPDRCVYLYIVKGETKGKLVQI